MEKSDKNDKKEIHMNFGLEKDELDFIVQAIKSYGDIGEALIFGSRAMGNWKRASDIDIALKGELKEQTVSSLSHFLNNASPFAYTVDVVHYEELSNAELKKHIDDFGKVIFKI